MKEYEREALSSLKKDSEIKTELVGKQNFQPMQNSGFLTFVFIFHWDEESES